MSAESGRGGGLSTCWVADAYVTFWSQGEGSATATVALHPEVKASVKVVVVAER